MKTVTVFFSWKSGMGDAGKFAAAHALRRDDCNVRIVAVVGSPEERKIPDLDVDVKDPDVRQELLDTLNNAGFEKVDLADEDINAKFETFVDGVDGVVSCLGNREPFRTRWINQGNEAVCRAMKNKNTDRLVCLSSFGIGDDFMPPSKIKKLWKCMLYTIIAPARRDLVKTEATVRDSGLDWLLARPVGLDPERAPRDKIDYLDKRGEDLEFGASKWDHGLFLLDQVLNPTLHRTAVTIGYKKE